MKRVNCARAITSSVGRQAMASSWGNRSIIFPFAPYEWSLRNKCAWCGASCLLARPSAEAARVDNSRHTAKVLPDRLSRFANAGFLPNRMQPAAVFRPSSGDGFKECFLDRFRDWAGRAVADSAPVDFADRGDLDRRAGQEGLVGVEQLVEFERADFDFVTQITRYPHRRIARDAEQDRRVLIVGQQTSVLDEKNVFDRALGQIAMHIEQDRFVVTARRGFAHGQDRIQIIARGLRRGRNHARMELFVGRDRDAHSPSEFLSPEIVWPFPGQDVDADRTDAANAQAAAVEIGCRANVTAFELVPANRFANRFVQFLLRVWNVELINSRRRVEPIHVLFQPEDSRAHSGFIATNPFKNAHAVMKPEGG